MAGTGIVITMNPFPLPSIISYQKKLKRANREKNINSHIVSCLDFQWRQVGAVVAMLNANAFRMFTLVKLILTCAVKTVDLMPF